MSNDHRSRAIDLAISQIEKQFGNGSIMRLGEDTTLPGVQAISTGALSLDIALGVGGVPRITSYNVCYTKLLRLPQTPDKQLYLV